MWYNTRGACDSDSRAGRILQREHIIEQTPGVCTCSRPTWEKHRLQKAREHPLQRHNGRSQLCWQQKQIFHPDTVDNEGSGVPIGREGLMDTPPIGSPNAPKVAVVNPDAKDRSLSWVRRIKSFSCKIPHH